jgi:single-strand DNA-binding protein
MAISITGKLNKAANQFQAGESKGFGVRLGVKFYNRETKQNEYTNYEAVIFGKAGAQADFYASALVEGAVIEVSGSGGQIKTFEGKNGLSISIAILDAKLGYVASSEAPQQAQQAPQAQQQQASYDSDIPF